MKKLTPGQMKIAKVAPPYNTITKADFQGLKKKKSKIRKKR